MADRRRRETPSAVRTMTGWGRTAPSAARVVRPTTAAELAGLLSAPPGRGLVARGLGRSYGDAAQNAGGTVVDMGGLARLHTLDADAATARVDAGLSLDRLMRSVLPLGLWPVVTPGTRQVTVGGAIASDIHGKNHHVDGTFAAHVRSLVLATPVRGLVEVRPDRDGELFWATAGGMGLTGVVAEAEVDLLRVETSSMRVDATRFADLDALLARMVQADTGARYSVAWIDGLARGRALGRSILELAEHARLEDLPPGRRDADAALRLPAARSAGLPPWVPGRLLNRFSAAAFNELWYRKASPGTRRHLVPAFGYFHPLDAVRDWNRLYGPSGLVQYQFTVPDGAEDVLRHAIERFSAARAASFLSVLKRFGPANPGPLSFPRQGWTLALDLPASAPGLGALLDGLDERVAAAGGRVYLSKDSRLRPELLEAMYPELRRWQAIRDAVDPERRLCSDLARRLPLVAAQVRGAATVTAVGELV